MAQIIPKIGKHSIVDCSSSVLGLIRLHPEIVWSFLAPQFYANGL